MRRGRGMLVLLASAVSMLVVSGVGSAAKPSGSVEFTLSCDKGISNATAEVWLIQTSTIDTGIFTNNSGYARLECGQSQPSFHVKTTVVPSGSYSYVHVEYGAAAYGADGRRYLCISGFSSGAPARTLPVKEQCPVNNNDKKFPAITVTVK
jgi:hypothetical protein